MTAGEQHARPWIFDGHNDLLSRIATEQCSIADVQNGYSRGHLDLPRAQKGRLGGGLCAIFVDNDGFDLSGLLQQMEHPPYLLPMPPDIPPEQASPRALEQASILQQMHQQGIVHLCTDTRTLAQKINQPDLFAAVLHLEGAEPIDNDLQNLDTLYKLGLRSLGSHWSRNNRFGDGVPFAYPASPDLGDGLTPLGRDLIRQCNQIGIMLDVSHLNLKGFNDLARITTAPIVASHSNAHALSPHSRNLTDHQLDTIRESDGLVGVNFSNAMLRADGRQSPDTPLEEIVRHLRYLIERLGETRVALGSDFDGATIPKQMTDCAGLATLDSLLDQSGFDHRLKENIFQKNWLRVLKVCWNEA